MIDGVDGDNKNNNKIVVIAITGRSGSGKSTVANYYKSKNFFVTDADVVAKQVTEKCSECLSELVEVFGENILNENGELNKKNLANRAFSSAQLTKKLTDITHPYIVNILLKQIDKAKNDNKKIAFVDGAVIIGGMFEQYCDEIILITSPNENAVTRIMQRDNVTKETAEKRLSVQLSNKEMIKKCAYVIENDGEQYELLKKADEVIEKIISKWCLNEI